MSLLVWLPLISDTENKGLSDVTVTNTNVTIDHTDANLGGCGYFNGSARIQISLPAELTSLKNTTVAGWIKGTGCMGGISHDTGYVSCCTMTGTNWQFTNGSSWQIVNGTTSSAWRHVVATIGEDTITTYYNGNVVTTASISDKGILTDLSSSTNFIEIGSDFPGGNEYLTGRICDFRVYNHCLSKKEVKELAKGLMTHLPLDWGANPNMIKKSYTWMNKNVAECNSNSCTVTRSVIEDDSAPCKYVYKCVMTNATDSNKGSVGGYFRYYAMGLALTDLTENEIYTYSFWAKADSSNTTNLTLSNGAVCEGQTRLSDTGFGVLTNRWRKHTLTFKWTKTTALTACFYVTIPAGTTQTYYLCGIKLEKGAKATPYIPNVEEDAYVNGGYANKYYEDCSGYCHGVTITNGASLNLSTDSPRGTGTNWNGGGRLVLTNGMPVGTRIPFTINTWIRMTEGATQTRYRDLYGFTLTSANGTSMYTRCEIEQVNGTNIHWHGLTNSSTQFAGDMPITPGVWTMVTLISDGEKIYTYKNGVLHKTKTYAEESANWQTLGSLTVGDQSAGNVYYDQADFRVYATALSADDVKELYQVAAQIDKNGNMYCGTLVEE